MKKRKRHSPEQIVKKLRDADAMLAAGKSVGEVLQSLGQESGDTQLCSLQVHRPSAFTRNGLTFCDLQAQRVCRGNPGTHNFAASTCIAGRLPSGLNLCVPSFPSSLAIILCDH